jgi:glycosyltransferase involved in cell wall biosynthesis
VIRGDVRLDAPKADRATWRDQLGLAEDDFVACMLAHFHSGKDHHTLLHAWRRVLDTLDSNPNPVMLLAGRDAGSMSAAKALAFDLDLREHVRFLGDVEDVAGLLGCADLAVFSSRSELFGRGATEPMRAGLPVVGTDVPGIREAVGEECAAHLAPPGDDTALAASIICFARDPGLRARIGEANARLLKARQPVQATWKVYAKLLAGALR